MAELHIALCTDGIFPEVTGGMQRHSRLLAEHMATIPGVRLTVFHPHATGLFDPALGIREVHVPDIDGRKLYLGELWAYSGRMAAALQAEMDQPGGPRAILSQGFSIWKNITRFSSQLMVHPHGLEMFQGLTRKERWMGWPFRRLVRHVARNSARVVSLGGKLTPILEQVVKGTATQVVELPNAVEVPPHAPPYPADEGPLQLLFVGRFAFNKGIDLLMGVADRLQGGNLGDAVQFNLAGTGPLFETYRSAGVPANVRLLGRVGDDELVRLYQACHGFVLPTRFEGMPTVVLEAMAHARPVLVSDVGAAAELVAPGESGYLLPPGDAEALYQAVRRLADTSPGQRSRMGAAGYRMAKEQFAWPVVARRHVEALKDMHPSAHLGVS